MTTFLRKGEWCVVLFRVSLMALILLSGATGSRIGDLILVAILVVIFMTMTALMALIMMLSGVLQLQMKNVIQ